MWEGVTTEKDKRLRLTLTEYTEQGTIKTKQET